MLGLSCGVSYPGRTMCFEAGRPSNLFKVLFTLSFLIIRAANATWWYGKHSKTYSSF